jgi:hypothetical protein
MVVNDLDYSIAINPRCWSKSVSGADPVRVSAGGDKVIHPGAACMVHGPTKQTGPFGMAWTEGPYIGCLLMPADDQRESVSVPISSAREDISFSTCDETDSGATP